MKQAITHCRIVLAAFCLLSLTNCVPMQTEQSTLPDKTDYAAYDNLVKLGDLNESTYKYLQYCQKSAQPNPAFVKNYKYVLDKLLADTMTLQGTSAARASGQIMQRRAALQASLDDAYQKDGCNSAMADRAAQQYKLFGNLTPVQIDTLVKEGLSSSTPQVKTL